MDIQGIIDFVNDNKLEDKSVSGFWNYFINYQRDYKEEFSKEFPEYNANDIELFTDNVSLQITNWPDDGYNHVIIAIRIHYKGEYAGVYKMIFNLSGEVEDDHLSLI